MPTPFKNIYKMLSILSLIYPKMLHVSKNKIFFTAAYIFKFGILKNLTEIFL
jgi:hypothetical protein